MRTFRPSLRLTLAAVVLSLLTFRLALWQFDRAEQKQALESAARAAANATAITIRQPQPIKPFQRVALPGSYLPAQELLLDNRVYRGRAGYHVLTPFQLTGGGAVMVNRGWLPGDGTRREPPVPPPPAGTVTVQGVFYNDSADAFRLSQTPESGRVRQYLDVAAYREESDLPLLSLVLIKEPDPDGSTAAHLPPATIRLDYKSRQSTIYAWQWLSFCLLTLCFYVLLSLRKK